VSQISGMYVDTGPENADPDDFRFLMARGGVGVFPETSQRRIPSPGLVGGSL
jgi:hypothetical protein